MIINENTIIEKLTLIEFTNNIKNIKLHDYLLGQTVLINKIGYDICQRYNGVSTLGSIASDMSDKYSVSYSDALLDTIQFTKILVQKKICLVVNSLYYKYIKFYYRLINIKKYNIK